jgi:dihydrofolate reductase
MSMSLDGFIAGPNEGPDNGLGDGGHRLHQWSPEPEPDRTVLSGHLAGGNVLVHGAGTAQLALAAGVLDELEIHLIPVLFGQGRRLFEGLAAEQIELERTRILEGEGGVTHMHYRVRR